MTTIFTKLKKFYFNKKNVKSFAVNEFNNHLEEKKNKVIKKKNTNKKNNMHIFEKDKLFWHLYIFENGYDNYELLGRNKYSKEMEIKVRYIEQLKNEKRLLKDHKLKFTDIQENLLYNPMDIFCFFSIIMLKKINFVYFTDSIVFIHQKYDKETMYIYHDKVNKLYDIKKNKNIEELKQNRLEIKYLKKPLKSLSNYKVKEIYDICNILKIEIMKNASKKYTKKELYQKIVQKIL